MMTADMVEECGLTVLEASSADAALQVLHERGGEIAVVMTDVRMPGSMDGVGLAEVVADAWPNIRVLVTSGYASGRLSALPPSAKFIPKPWNPLDVINFVLEAARPESS
jgi:DNA-binding NtrC family response regulator